MIIILIVAGSGLTYITTDSFKDNKNVKNKYSKERKKR